MEFVQQAVYEKKKYLDTIKQYPDYLKFVLEKYFGKDYFITEIPRRWLGGGSTSFLVKKGNEQYFLKVKHKNVMVETKLEEELATINESCIAHEYKMLQKAKRAGVHTPEILFFDEYKDYQFIATVYIEKSLSEILQEKDITTILNLWQDLIENVNQLFNAKLVHSDIHEYNIRVDSMKKIVLIDFEECRELEQKCEFENSLDFIGHNDISKLGNFPLWDSQKYLTHINCLERMKEFFKDYIVAAINQFIKECYYDSSNGICNSLDHGKSEKIYQPIKNMYIDVAGQRGQEDIRAELVAELTEKIFKKTRFTFVDIGSNNGLFVREISQKYFGNNRSIGLEGFSKFNVLAKALSFLEDCKNTEYIDFICGENDLAELNITGPCFLTMCSVWHHIQHKKNFLNQMKKLDIRGILIELATQDECYNHTWKEELNNITGELRFKEIIRIGNSKDYNRPLFLIMPEKLKKEEKQNLKKILELARDRKVNKYFNNQYQKKYIIFGAGYFGRLAFHLLGSDKVSYYIDNDVNIQGNELFEKKIYSFKEGICNRTNEQIVIAVSKQYEDQMKQQLLDNKVDNYILLSLLQMEIERDEGIDDMQHL